MKARTVWLVTLLLLTTCGALGQQSDTAVVVGVVGDATGAVIPGVDMRFTHAATGAIYSTQTDVSGFYRTPPLRIGEYLMEAESAGFKRIQRTGVVLNAGDTRQVDLVLEIGEATETIEVVAQAPLLQTQEGATGTVMENQQILELPLNGRDYLQLARISAGVTPPARSEVANRQGVSVGGSISSSMASTTTTSRSLPRAARRRPSSLRSTRFRNSRFLPTPIRRSSGARWAALSR